MIGSMAYAADQAQLQSPIVAVLQMDMIGYDVRPGRAWELHAGFTPSPEVEQRSLALASMVAELVPQTSPDLPPPQVYPVAGEPDAAEERSDHYSFQAHGYAAPRLRGPVRRSRARRAARGDESRLPLGHGQDDQPRLRGRHRPRGHRRRLGRRHAVTPDNAAHHRFRLERRRRGLNGVAGVSGERRRSSSECRMSTAGVGYGWPGSLASSCRSLRSVSRPGVFRVPEATSSVTGGSSLACWHGEANTLPRVTPTHGAEGQVDPNHVDLVASDWRGERVRGDRGAGGPAEHRACRAQRGAPVRHRGRRRHRGGQPQCDGQGGAPRVPGSAATLRCSTSAGTAWISTARCSTLISGRPSIGWWRAGCRGTRWSATRSRPRPRCSPARPAPRSSCGPACRSSPPTTCATWRSAPTMRRTITAGCGRWVLMHTRRDGIDHIRVDFLSMILAAGPERGIGRRCGSTWATRRSTSGPTATGPPPTSTSRSRSWTGSSTR